MNITKTVSLLFLSIFLILSNGCASQPTVKPSPPPKSLTADMELGRLVNYLRDSTVVLHQIVDAEDELYSPLCSGVWVDEEHILTAAHCFSDNNPHILAFETFGYYKKHLSDVMSFDDGLPRAYLVARDTSKDLALMITVSKPPPHSVVSLASESYPGQRVHMVGMTEGLLFNYLPGDISAVRVSLRHLIKSKKMKLFQVHTDVYFGYSGGGMFNSRGELMGVCSFGVPVPSTAFYIHRDEIKEFLSDNLFED